MYKAVGLRGWGWWWEYWLNNQNLIISLPIFHEGSRIIKYIFWYILSVLYSYIPGPLTIFIDNNLK